MTGLVCLSVCIPLQLSAQSLLEKVAVDVVLGVYDKPKYQDERPYYFYNNRYYYGGEFRKSQYYYDGRRLNGGRYYERGYQDKTVRIVVKEYRHLEKTTNKRLRKPSTQTIKMAITSTINTI